MTGTAHPPLLLTIGHSTRPLEIFIGLLRNFAVTLAADVRTVPHSRHNPLERNWVRVSGRDGKRPSTPGLKEHFYKGLSLALIRLIGRPRQISMPSKAGIGKMEIILVDGLVDDAGAG
jgi:hypothetical protein